MENKRCPNCNTKLEGLFAGGNILDQKQIDFINVFHDAKKEAYCNNCGGMLFERYKAQLSTRKSELNKNLEQVIDAIPIITTNNPVGWDYDIISIVTAQSVSGTGMFTEIASSFSDLFGSQSGAMGNKLQKGENICMNILRLKALKIGGNAIISTDIDYAEVGSGKGMLMVCMAGTAIRLNNIDEIKIINSSRFLEATDIMNKLNEIDEYYKN